MNVVLCRHNNNNNNKKVGQVRSLIICIIIRIVIVIMSGNHFGGGGSSSSSSSNSNSSSSNGYFGGGSSGSSGLDDYGIRQRQGINSIDRNRQGGRATGLDGTTTKILLLTNTISNTNTSTGIDEPSPFIDTPINDRRKPPIKSITNNVDMTLFQSPGGSRSGTNTTTTTTTTTALLLLPPLFLLILIITQLQKWECVPLLLSIVTLLVEGHQTIDVV